MSKKKRYASAKELITLTDDEHELVELLNDAQSLFTQADNIRALRSAEVRLIKEKLFKIREDGPVVGVTDHALVRYLERVKGVPIDEIRAEMVGYLPDEVTSKQIQFVKAGELWFVVRDGLIITVRPKPDELPRRPLHEALPSPTTPGVKETLL